MNISARYFPLFFLLTALLAVIAFVPALSGGFVLDDGFNILKNRLLYVDVLHANALVDAALSFHDGNGGRPLPMLSFALDYWRAGSMDATTFKATNLIIHGATIFFLAFMFRRLLLLAGWAPRQAVWGALVFALAWGIHPLQVSSVMYVVQRMQTMATFFLVLALWAYLGMRQVQIDGTGRGRVQGILVLVFWFLAMACKEDAPLLFAYVLVLELTVLRFRAEEPDIAKGLRQSFLLLTVLAVLAYLFAVVPYYWHWEVYPGRNFSTLERLMTQMRVLAMYLGQIVFPYPGNMTFIYDTLPVSRSLWQPLSTFPSALLVAALLVWAWRWRCRRPLFSLGLLLFFSGHFISSNVIGLELVFEHRNHFPLIGMVLALGDLCVLAWRRCHAGARVVVVWVGVVMLVLSAATLSHAYTWGDPVRHGEKLVELLPDSTRAWTQLGGAHFDRYNATGRDVHLQRAIEVNEEGLKHVKSPSLASNLVIYKSLLGSVAESDWQRFFTILHEAPQSWQNKFVIWTMMNNVDRGFDLDAQRVAEAIDILTNKAALKTSEYLRVAVFVYKYSQQNKARSYFVRFAESASADDSSLFQAIRRLESSGHEDWARELRSIQAGKKEISVNE